MAPLMKLIRQLGFLRLGADAAPKREVDDDRVLHLFRNRAELKKAYSGVQDEVQRLKDRIKQQEGATARVQEMLQGLEARLGQPETGLSGAGVLSAARAVDARAARCSRSSSPNSPRSRKSVSGAPSSPNTIARQFARRQGVDANAARGREPRPPTARAAVAQLEQQLAQLRRFWHYFKRRALRAAAAGGESAVAAVRAGSGERRAPRAMRSMPSRRRNSAACRSMRAARSIWRRSPTGRCCASAWRAHRWWSWRARRPARREPPREDYGDRPRCEATMAEIARGARAAAAAQPAAAGDQAARRAAARAGEVSQRRRYGADGREPRQRRRRLARCWPTTCGRSIACCCASGRQRRLQRGCTSAAGRVLRPLPAHCAWRRGDRHRP